MTHSIQVRIDIALMFIYGLGSWYFARHFQQYFSYINSMAVSYIDGGNRRTQRKPPTCCKSL